MYRRKPKNWLKHLDFILIDLICLQVSFLAAYCLRHGMVDPFINSMYRNTALIQLLISIVVSAFFESFKDVLKRGYYVEFAKTVKHVVLVELFTAFYLFSTQEAVEYSRTVLYLTGILYIILGYLTRLGWKVVLKRKRISFGASSLILITTEDRAAKCLQNLQGSRCPIPDVTGIAILDKDKKGDSIEGIPVIADKSTLVDYICREWVDEVLIDLPESETIAEELSEQIIGMGVIVHKRLVQAEKQVGRKQFVERVGSYTVLTTSINYATPRQLYAKRIMDIIGGILGTIITGILFLFLAPVIKIQSPGPVFFAQERVGRNGKKFKIYKFRTMYLDAEERKAELMAQNRVSSELMFKLDFDPRIIGNKILPDGTRKTGFMETCRRLSLDEFPQFFNVLKGDMSLVGTRPPTVDEFNRYEPHHRARLAAKPGITGMWQVSGRSNITDFEDVVKLDMQYISEWSMGLDFRILFKTVAVVLKREGSM